MKTEKTEKIERTEKTQKTEKAEKTEKTEKTQQTEETEKTEKTAEHIFDLHCVRLLNVPFCENSRKLCCDAKHLGKGLNRSNSKILGALFSKKKSVLSGQYWTPS